MRWTKVSHAAVLALALMLLPFAATAEMSERDNDNSSVVQSDCTLPVDSDGTQQVANLADTDHNIIEMKGSYVDDSYLGAKDETSGEPFQPAERSRAPPQGVAILTPSVDSLTEAGHVDLVAQVDEDRAGYFDDEGRVAPFCNEVGQGA